MALWDLQVTYATMSTIVTARLTAHCGCHLRAHLQRRDVFLLCKPATHISDYWVKSPLTFSEDGELKEAKYVPSHSYLLDLDTSRSQHILPRQQPYWIDDGD